MEFRKQQNKENTGIGIERRTFNAEYRASGEGAKKVGGMAAMYDKPTDMGWFVEVVKPGFFDGIDTTETACLKNHDHNLILGRTANNTLQLSFLPEGLDYEATVPDTVTGNDTYTEVKGGYIYKSSFAFTVAEAKWYTVPAANFAGVFPEDVVSRLTYGGEIEVRELVKGRTLYDVSPVTYPAYQSSSADARENNSLREERNKFLPVRPEELEDRAKVKVELEIEVDTDEEKPGEDMPPETSEPETEPEDVTAYARQLQINQNRLRIAQAARTQFINL